MAIDLSPEYLLMCHQFSNHHRASVKPGTLCGCFYCEKIFDPAEHPIKEWINGDVTALCPICGINSVISSADLPEAIEPALLRGMNEWWFGEEIEAGELSK
jgi:hypothetical protein